MAKIGVIIPYKFIKPTNGGHAAAYGFCTFLSKKKDVIVLSTVNNDDEAEIPFTLMKLFTDRFYKYFSPIVAARLFYFLRNEGVTHCIIQQPFIGLIVLPITKLLGIKLFVYSHNIEFERFRSIGRWWWGLVKIIERMIYRGANGIFFISEDDLKTSIPIFKLNPKYCLSVPFGTFYASMPFVKEHTKAKIISRHHLQPDGLILLFFGSLSYQPNTEALVYILKEINPLLLKRNDFNYKILICGSGLPEKFDNLDEYKTQHIEFVGFVENIEEYIQAADITLNPVISGGGVKTKMIEAIAIGTSVIATESGAKGVNKAVCGEKLMVVPDYDFEAFANAIIKLKNNLNHPTPLSFYETYYWENAIKPVVELIK